jgi:uncharacterized protein (DUF1697 family)
MAEIIAMLRAVNVGGHNKIKMEELRALCVSLKLGDPVTYVQSGNVIFSAAERDLAKLGKGIEDAIEKKCGFRPDAILRNAEEMKEAIARNPFSERKNIDPGKLLVMFLSRDPGPQARSGLRKIRTEPEELQIEGREVYIYFPNGMGRPKMSWAAVNKALGVPGTGRNWNSVTRMLAMAESRAARDDGGEQIRRVRRICSALPGTTERLSHGAPTFFTNKKVYAMFANNHHNDGHVAVWLPAALGVQTSLIGASPEKFFKPPYVGGAGWVGVEIDRVDDEELAGYLADAWQLITRKKRR